MVDSFTSSPRQIVVTAKAPGVSSLILWDEARPVGDLLGFLRPECRESTEGDSRRRCRTRTFDVEAQQDRISLSGTVWSDASAEAAAKLAGLYAKNVVNSVR